VAGPLGRLGGALVGPADGAKWAQGPCHVHLLPLSIFVTNLHKFCYNSYIQIILQVQVELGEL
jgi:hypothetical protein